MSNQVKLGAIRGEGWQTGAPGRYKEATLGLGAIKQARQVPDLYKWPRRRPDGMQNRAPNATLNTTAGSPAQVARVALKIPRLDRGGKGGQRTDVAIGW